MESDLHHFANAKICDDRLQISCAKCLVGCICFSPKKKMVDLCISSWSSYVATLHRDI